MITYVEEDLAGTASAATEPGTDGDIVMASADATAPASPRRQPVDLVSSTAEAGPSSAPAGPQGLSSLSDEDAWVPFDILETAPQEHHFFNEPRPATATKTYLSRLQKEHRALATSLPGEFRQVGANPVLRADEPFQRTSSFGPMRTGRISCGF